MSHNFQLHILSASVILGLTSQSFLAADDMGRNVKLSASYRF